MANKYEFGGRDSLIMAHGLFDNLARLYSHDEKIVNLGIVKDKELEIPDPVL